MHRGPCLAFAYLHVARQPPSLIPSPTLARLASTRLASTRLASARLASVGIALASVVACQPELPAPGEPVTSLEWVQASARVHDPAGLWSQFAAEVVVASVNEDGRLAFREDLYVDRGADTFRRAIVTRGALLTQTAGPSGCTARWPGARDIRIGDLRRNGLEGEPCEAIGPPRDLHEFLIGLPMSVLGPATRFGESPSREQVFGREVTRVQLVFEDDPGGQAWALYVDPDTKAFVGAGFTDSRGGGERFDYGDYVDFGGFRLAQRRTVTEASSEDFVIEQRVGFEALAE